MKQLVPVLFALIFSLGLHTLSAQDFPYNLTVLNETYTPIQNGTSVNNGMVWDDPEFQIPIGFNFDVFGQTITDLYWIGAVGAIMLGDDYYSASPAFIVYGSDIVDLGYDVGGPSQSPIVYEVVGTAPNRIFKLEYQNAGFYGEYPAASFVNFQMWLYETSNIIEYRFGPSNIASPVHDYGNGPLVGFIDLLDVYSYDYGTLFYLTGSPNDPTVQSGDIYYIYEALNGDPEDGLVYRFGPAVAVNVTLNVDMNEVIASGGTVSPDGVHVAGNFQGWDPGATLMTDNGDGTWTHTFTTLSETQIQYKFINGTNWPEAETSITTDCGADDGYGNFNRIIDVEFDDIETIDYCFDYCVECINIPTGIDNLDLAGGIEIFPNPVSDLVQIQIDLPEAGTDLQLQLTNTLGQVLQTLDLGQTQFGQIELDLSDLPAGMYQILILDGEAQAVKTIVKH